MDYKSVIEEQIRELQKLQDKLRQGRPEEVAPMVYEIAVTIAALCRDASDY